MATVEELKRLKKRKKKAEVKAKSKGGPKGGKPMGGAGQDYVTSGKGDLSRGDYIDIREYRHKGAIKDQKKFAPDDWADRLYTDRPIDKKIGKQLGDLDYMMYANTIYKTTPKDPKVKFAKAKISKMNV